MVSLRISQFRTCCVHRLYIIQIPQSTLATYRLWSPMLRFVHDNIKVYNVRERKVHLTEASPISCLQNVLCILWTLWGYHVQPGVSRCLKTTGNDHSVCTILSGCIVIFNIDSILTVNTVNKLDWQGKLKIQIWSKFINLFKI